MKSMSRKIVLQLVVACLLAVLGIRYGYGRQSQALQDYMRVGGPLTVEKIRDDMYVIERAGGNSTLLITGDGAILVDDKSAEDHDHLVEKIKSVTDQPVKYIFNTHSHGNHAGGNARMLPGPQIIAQAKTRELLAKANQPGLPNIVFDRECDVFLGGKEVRAFYFGPGHTDGDTFIYFPADRVIAAGDMVDVGEEFPPLIDYPVGGTAKGWVKALDEALKLDFDTVVPGLGPISKREAFVNFAKDFKASQDRVREMLAQGKSKDDISKMLATDYHWDKLHITRSLDGLIAEMKP